MFFNLKFPFCFILFTQKFFESMQYQISMFVSGCENCNTQEVLFEPIELKCQKYRKPIKVNKFKNIQIMRQHPYCSLLKL